MGQHPRMMGQHDQNLQLDFFISLRGYDIKDQGLKANKGEQLIKNEIEEYINTVLGDGLRLTATHFARMEQHGFINDVQLHEVLNNLTARYSPFLQPYANNKTVVNIYPKAPTNAQLFEAIASNPDLKNLAQEMDTYALYSKYEHFNIMSYDAFRRENHEQGKTVREKIDILVLHTFKIVNMLLFYIHDDFLKQMQTNIGTYIGQEIFELNQQQIEQMLANS